MSLEVHCGTVMDHITGKMHCTSEPGRTACWMQNSLSQNTQNQLGVLALLAQCVCVVGLLDTAIAIYEGMVYITMSEAYHYSYELERQKCSGASVVMNETFTPVCTNRSFSSGGWELHKATKQSIVNTVCCLLQELGYQPLLATNSPLLCCNCGKMHLLEQECNHQ